MAVLGRQVPVITQLGFLATTLTRQQRVGIGGGLVSLVAPFLPMKVHRRVARIVRRLVDEPFVRGSWSWYWNAVATSTWRDTVQPFCRIRSA